jgi:hypothetical protein
MKKLKLGLLIAFIFIAGFVSGIVVTRVVVRHFVQRALAHPEMIRAMIERRLTRNLRLDADQQVKVHNILLNTHEQMDALRQQFRPGFTNIIQNTVSQISAILTPEQQEKFDRLRAKEASFLPSR